MYPNYSSCERAINERSNCILIKFIPKAKSINNYITEEIFMLSDETSLTPKNILDYTTPEELFDIYLDVTYPRIKVNCIKKGLYLLLQFTKQI